MDGYISGLSTSRNHANENNFYDYRTIERW